MNIKGYLGAIVFFTIGLGVSAIVGAAAGWESALICVAIAVVLTVILVRHILWRMRIRRQVAALYDGSYGALWGDDRVRRNPAHGDVTQGGYTGLDNNE